jgi:hypothetical protein
MSLILKDGGPGIRQPQTDADCAFQTPDENCGGGLGQILEVEEAVSFAGIEERQDVRVLEIRGGLDFLDEPLGPQHGGEFGAQDFHRHWAVEIRLGRHFFTRSAGSW